jgi:uncharacterized membrane protein
MVEVLAPYVPWMLDSNIVMSAARPADTTFRARFASAFGRDRQAALVEDAITIGGAFIIVTAPRWSS